MMHVSLLFFIISKNKYRYYLPGRAGLEFGGGGAEGIYNAEEGGRGADDAVRVLLWK